MTVMGTLKRSEAVDITITAKNNPRSIVGFWVVKKAGGVVSQGPTDVVPNTAFTKRIKPGELTGGRSLSLVVDFPDNGSCAADIEVRQGTSVWKAKDAKRDRVWTYGLVP
jgi:hypothetical protein